MEEKIGLKVFIDTSAFAAHFNQSDTNHKAALALWKMLASGGWRLWTSSYILAECVTVLRGRAGHAAALRFGDALLTSRLVSIIRPSPAQDSAAMELFRRFDDQRFSFFDCSSFALMRDLSISRAFAFDQDFVIAGFEVLKP
jgi:predicted nucleic acid-binding protein